METLIAQILNRFESGKLSRRQLIGSLTAAAATFGSGAAALIGQTRGAPAASGAQAPAAAAAARTAPARTLAQELKAAELRNAIREAPFKAIQVSHIRYTCKDYRLARDYYQEIMGMHLVPGSDTGSQCKLAFYPAGVTPIGQPKGTPSGFMILRNGWQAPPAPVPGSTTPRVNIDHIAYNVQFDKPLPNGKVEWIDGTQCDKNGPLEAMRAILQKRGFAGIRQDHQTSFHVTDPNGYDLQISGVGMSGYVA